MSIDLAGAEPVYSCFVLVEPLRRNTLYCPPSITFPSSKLQTGELWINLKHFFHIHPDASLPARFTLTGVTAEVSLCA